MSAGFHVDHSAPAQLLALIEHARQSPWLISLDAERSALVLFYTMSQAGHSLRLVHAQLRVSSPTLASRGRTVVPTVARAFELQGVGSHTLPVFIGRDGDLDRRACLAAHAKSVAGDGATIYRQATVWETVSTHGWETYRPYHASMLSREELTKRVDWGLSFLAARHLTQALPEAQCEDASPHRL